MTRREFIGTAGAAAAGTLVAGRARAAVAAEPPLRVAQLGTAHAHAAGKWDALRRLDDVFACAGICEPDPERRAAAAADPDYRGARWLSEEELWNDASIRALLVETELPDLLNLGRRCLESGRHLHLEKPPGTDLGGFARLQQLARDSNLVLQVGYMFRHHPAFIFCREAVRRGWLGRVFSVHGDIGKALDPERREWLGETYHGSMMLLGCHLLDQALAILGAPTAVRAFRRNTHPGNDRFHDHEVAVLEYPGALATIRSMLAEVGGGDRRQFVVFGTNGTLTIAPLEPARVQLVLEKPAGGYAAGTHEIPLPPVTGRYDATLHDFAGMIAGRPSQVPEFTADHEHLLHRTLLQAAGFLAVSS